MCEKNYCSGCFKPLRCGVIYYTATVTGSSPSCIIRLLTLLLWDPSFSFVSVAEQNTGKLPVPTTVKIPLPNHKTWKHLPLKIWRLVVSHNGPNSKALIQLTFSYVIIPLCTEFSGSPLVLVLETPVQVDLDNIATKSGLPICAGTGAGAPQLSPARLTHLPHPKQCARVKSLSGQLWHVLPLCWGFLDPEPSKTVPYTHSRHLAF